MKTAVVILNYANPELTERLAGSFLAFDSLDHIIVVDNFSPDNSFKRLSALQGGKISVIRTDHNGGYGFGNNFGIRFAKENFDPDFVFISNPDVMVEERTVKAMIAALEANPSLAVAAPQMRYQDKDFIPTTAWRIPTLKSEILSSGIVFYKLFHNTGLLHFYTPAYIKNNGPLCYVDCVMGSFFAARTSAMLDAGLYDEDFFLYCEESVLGYRLKQLGFQSAILSDFSFVHFESATIDLIYKSTSAKKRLDFRSKKLFLKKYQRINFPERCLAHMIFGLWTLESMVFDVYTKVVMKIKKFKT